MLNLNVSYIHADPYVEWQIFELSVLNMVATALNPLFTHLFSGMKGRQAGLEVGREEPSMGQRQSVSQNWLYKTQFEGLFSWEIA